jgi:hypothetical protein
MGSLLDEFKLKRAYNADLLHLAEHSLGAIRPLDDRYSGEFIDKVMRALAIVKQAVKENDEAVF